MFVIIDVSVGLDAGSPVDSTDGSSDALLIALAQKR